MTKDELTVLIKGLVPVLRAEFAKRDARIATLEREIAAQREESGVHARDEREPDARELDQLTHRGAWNSLAMYAKGEVVDFAGSTWICQVPLTNGRPGRAKSGWQLW